MTLAPHHIVTIVQRLVGQKGNVRPANHGRHARLTHRRRQRIGDRDGGGGGRKAHQVGAQHVIPIDGRQVLHIDSHVVSFVRQQATDQRQPQARQERLVEHALRHAKIQNKQLGMERVAGAIGWCAFDYNTHIEFGSGDRICYHGVMDIFRLPKHAAYLYGSQIDPSVRVVLRAATIWAKGERSIGGFEPTWVFTNCDEIEVFVGDEKLGRFQPDRETHPHLPHPPVKITGFKDFWGQKRHLDLRMVGYLNKSTVAEHCISADGIPHALELRVDDAQIHADGADMTRLTVRIVDRYGNRLPFTQAAVSFEIDGPAELIGENPFVLMGGQAALYIKARHEPGTVTIRAQTARLAPAEITLEIVG